MNRSYFLKRASSSGTGIEHDKNASNMRQDMVTSAIEMLEAAGLENVKGNNSTRSAGTLIHEMGGACMGKDAKTSYLNKWNQSHEVNNLFVTDGAAFSYQASVNPSLTFMALTARAVDFADKQLKKGLI